MRLVTVAALFLLLISARPSAAQPEVAKQADGTKSATPASAPDAEKPSISKETWKWVELAVKLLLFLSFWCVTSEVIQLPVWETILDRTAKGLAILCGILVFIVVVRSTSWNSPPEEKNDLQTLRLYSPLMPSPLVPKDDFPSLVPKDSIQHMMWELEKQRAINSQQAADLEKVAKRLKMRQENRGFAPLVERLWAWIKVNIPGIATVAGGYVLACVAGGLALFVVRLVLSGCKDRLSSKYRLILGAVAFALAGVLDIAVWAFKPD